jgi:hypothetical protein
MMRRLGMLTIISGGQTGVDRAALDAAIALGLPYGAWCPNGGWAEDLPEPPGLLERYPSLRETPDRDPRERTEWNVRDSDALLILIAGIDLSISKGTAFAVLCAERHGRPCLILDLHADDATTSAALWLRARSDARLCIGGPRESEAPGIYVKALSFLQDVLRSVE